MLMDVTKMKIKRSSMAREPIISDWSVELPGKKGGKHKGIGENCGQRDYGKDHSKRDLEFLEGSRSQASEFL